MKVQAREIVRYAKRNNLKIEYGSVGWNSFCARAVVLHMFNGDKFKNQWWLYDEAPAKKTGLTMKQLDSLEAGFEGYDFEEVYNKRYYKMGQRVAKLAGL